MRIVLSFRQWYCLYINRKTLSCDELQTIKLNDSHERLQNGPMTNSFLQEMPTDLICCTRFPYLEDMTFNLC